MIDRRALLVASFVLALVTSAAAESTRTVRVTVKNLACVMCAGKIKKALLTEPGIETVEASVPEQRFTIGVRGEGPTDARLRELVERDEVRIVAVARD